MNKLNFIDIQKGDIALFKGSSFFGKMIRIVTRGKVNHAAYFIDKERIMHATNKGIVRQNLFEYLAQDSKIVCYICRVKSSEFPEGYNVTEEIRYAKSKEGMKYDWINIGALLWRSTLRGLGLWRIAKIKYILDTKRMKFICSEYIIDIKKYSKIDLTTVKHPQPALNTPQDLFKNKQLDKFILAV